MYSALSRAWINTSSTAVMPDSWRDALMETSDAEQSDTPSRGARTRAPCPVAVPSLRKPPYASLASSPGVAEADVLVE